jgi:hypothetical protein
MKNHWVCIRNEMPFAVWMASYKGSIDRLPQALQFADEVIAVGKESSVYQLKDFVAPYNSCGLKGYHADAFPTYSAYLQYASGLIGKMPFFDMGLNAVDLNAPGRICFYDTDDNLVERDVRDLGLLLEELGVDTADNAYAKRMPPVILFGYLDMVKDTSQLNWHLSIELWSDIWFPGVDGWRDEVDELDFYRHDNRELALCHTPRLNAFVARVRELALQVGAKWEIETIQIFGPLELITETGIKLDDLSG